MLKPGSLFAAYDWCITDKYSGAVAEHTHIRAEIELGNGIVELRTPGANLAALRGAGFEVLEVGAPTSVPLGLHPAHSEVGVVSRVSSEDAPKASRPCPPPSAPLPPPPS